MFSITLSEVREAETNPPEENFMKKNIVWLFVVAIALLAVPVSHASAVTRADSSFDGTVPQPPPVPLPGG